MLGFIGCGNMAQAMLKGILAEGLYKPEEIIVSRRSEEELNLGCIPPQITKMRQRSRIYSYWL